MDPIIEINRCNKKIKTLCYIIGVILVELDSIHWDTGDCKLFIKRVMHDEFTDKDYDSFINDVVNKVVLINELDKEVQ
ncbi:MAG TPA: hypothetical protein VNU45_19820 [Rummeliibacillus sp.]|nr:hypothetical protein [Rummeliibacillus sp.]